MRSLRRPALIASYYRLLSRRRRPEPSDGETKLPKREQVANADELNVEKHFPVALQHIRRETTDDVAQEMKETAWKEDVRAYDTRGVRTPPNTPKTFFEEGSVDIRSYRQKKLSGKSDTDIDFDILALGGGNPRRHEDLLANRSNEAPGDPTTETEAAEAYQGAPIQLTDMLKERLVELKAEKLAQKRVETFLPRRLKLDTAYPNPLITESSPLAPTEALDIVSYEARRILDSAEDLIPGKVNSMADRKLTKVTSTVEMGYGEDLTKEVHAANDGRVLLLRTLQRVGFCSRREALEIISSGKVTVNNKVERDPFHRVCAADDIHVKGHPSRLRFAPPRLWMYNKPPNVSVSRNDPLGRRLYTKYAQIFGYEHMIPVGSLPYKSHGVLMLTNDGELSRFLEHPLSKIQQTYMLRIKPAIDPVLAHKLNTDGIAINGVVHRDVQFTVNPAAKSRFMCKVTLKGEAMPVAELMKHLGRFIQRGRRVSFGPFSLGNLGVGSIREVTVPPFYMKHAGGVWKPFVERDWPFFRRLRLQKLKHLARFRELTPGEWEEIDSFTYDELRDSLSLESREVKDEASRIEEALRVRPKVVEPPLEAEWNTSKGTWPNGADFEAPSLQVDNDDVISDVTSLR
jgi:pseudouridylate synthase